MQLLPDSQENQVYNRSFQCVVINDGCCVNIFLISNESKNTRVCGVVFIDATGLDFPFELEIFYIEHFIPLGAVPILFLG
jgi:hypothetical protein